MSKLIISRLKGKHLSSTSSYKYKIEMDISDPDSKMSSRSDNWSVEKVVTSNIEPGGTLSTIPQSDATLEPNDDSNEVIFDDYIHTSSVDEVLDVYIDDSKDKKKKGFIKIKGNDKIIPSGPEPPAISVCRIVSIEFTKNSGSSTYTMEVSLDEMTDKKIKSLSVINNENDVRIIAIELQDASGNSQDSGTITSISGNDMSGKLQVVVDDSPSTTNIRQAIVAIG